MKKILFIICVALSFNFTAQAEDKVVPVSFIVITNKSVPKNDITIAILARAYMGSQYTWSNGEVIKAIHQTDSPLRDYFMDTLRRLSPIAVRNYWLQRIFSGQIWNAPELPDETEILSYVARTPGSVGYLSRYTALDLSHVTYFVFTIVP